MQTIKVKLTGKSPLLMHADRLANPLDPVTKEMKEITNKRKKTDEDILELSFVEFRGGLYHDDDIGPHIPQHWILAMLRDSAKLTKQGRDVVRSIFVDEMRLPLVYDGPRDIDGMWKAGFYDRRMVGNQRARILRTRPRFNEWQVRFTLIFDESVFNLSHINTILKSGGAVVGLGDYRPRFGRFDEDVVS